MDLDPEHTPKAASSWRWGGRCRPYACPERLHVSADTYTLADQPNSRFSVQHGDQEKQVAPHVGAAMQIATSPVKPARAAGPLECFGALPVGYWCS
eukprot:4922704-Pyramimonas_sp.AAC.1